MAKNSGIEITSFGLRNPESSERNLSVIWDGLVARQYFANIGKGKIDHFEVMWRYYAYGRWQSGNNITTNEVPFDYKTLQDDYQAENDATRVAVKIRAIGVKDNKGNKGWTGPWSDELFYYFKYLPPEKPEVPEVTIDDKKLKAHLENVSIDATGLEFEVSEYLGTNSSKSVTESYKLEQKISAITGISTVDWTIDIEYGASYMVRCRGYRYVGNSQNKEYIQGEWSEWSSPVVSPAKAPTLTTINVKTKNSIYVAWKLVKSAKQYIIQYVPKNPQITDVGIDKYFEIIGLSIQSETIDVKELNIDENAATYGTTIAGLSEGAEYYIRVGSSTNSGSSSSTGTKWSTPMSFILGTVSNPPSIWSSNKYVGVGDPLKLYWMHNPKDNSLQAKAIMELSYGTYKYDTKGNKEFVATETKEYTYPETTFDYIIKNSYKSAPDDIADQTYIWEVNTSDDRVIKWRMKTAGVLTDDSGEPLYGEWSEYNIVDIYEKPSMSLEITDINGSVIQSGGNLNSLPFKVNASVYEYDNQQPTGYYINIVADSSYESVDVVGDDTTVGAGTIVYSKYIDVNEFSLSEEISADSITLENNQSYTLYCTVYMNSGLSTQRSSNFVVSWDEVSYIPLATIYVDPDNLSASISPFVSNDVSEEVLLSVYRREYDGTFTLIQNDIDNATWCNDPHPALDYARYRIVAKSKATGSVEYQDIEPVEIGEKSLVIQWNEYWTPTDETRSSEYSRSGSMLKLPYNISISYSSSPDVSLVNYIGRKNPVSYYGTQKGEKSGWSTVIDKTDKETLAALRRLSVWMGDVYVREPSGTGYWANIKVNYSISSNDLTVPISIDITRVEGGK